MGGPFGQWAHQYDVPPRTQSGEGGMVAQSNKYPGSIPEGNKPIDLVILYCVLMPFYPSSTKRHETRFLASDFPLFNLDAGSMPSLLDNTVSLPFLIQPRHGLVCMK